MSELLPRRFKHGARRPRDVPRKKGEKCSDRAEQATKLGRSHDKITGPTDPQKRLRFGLSFDREAPELRTRLNSKRDQLIFRVSARRKSQAPAAVSPTTRPFPGHFLYRLCRFFAGFPEASDRSPIARGSLSGSIVQALLATLWRWPVPLEHPPGDLRAALAVGRHGGQTPDHDRSGESCCVCASARPHLVAHATGPCHA